MSEPLYRLKYSKNLKKKPCDKSIPLTAVQSPPALLTREYKGYPPAASNQQSYYAGDITFLSMVDFRINWTLPIGEVGNLAYRGAKVVSKPRLPGREKSGHHPGRCGF